MDTIGTCCEGCCKCCTACQKSNLALSCALFGTPYCCPSCSCCPNEYCKTMKKDIKGQYTKVFNSPLQVDMSREIVF